jgi:HEPN domain-containing protein
LAPPQLGFLDRARKLHQGLAALSALDANHADAAVFLAAWCLELSLKAYLAKHGQLKTQLQPIQHDLAALWRRSESFGLPIPKDPPRWCLLLSTLHAHPYHLRYPDNTAAAIGPAVHEVSVALGDLLHLIERELV